MTPFFSSIFLFVLLGAQRAWASPKASYDPLVEVPCHFGAFVIETDPKGLNVRAEPNAKAPILGTIPPMLAESGKGPYFVKPEVEVLGSKKGWIKIQKAKDNPIIEDMVHRKPRKMYEGVGWVSGKKLTVKSQASSAFDGPSLKDKILYKAGDSMDFDKIDSYRLLGCQGEWAFVEDRDLKKNNQYWLNQLCDVQETTCEGLSK